jgi:2-keto-3-deoxy-L-rhamnonate aldolase RhmA
MLDPQLLKERMQARRCAYGTLVVSPSPRWPSALARIGLDFVFIDTEHIALDRAQLSWMCQTYAAMGLSPLVRIPSPDPYQACMALDGGAGGIVAPYIETVEQVQVLVGAVKLRPLKGARLAEAMADPASLEPCLAAYLEQTNRHSLLIINIESTPAVTRLEELVSVPGVDAVLIGPHDLSCSLGLPEQYDHPRFEAAVVNIIEVARARGVAAGIHWWGDPARLAQWRDAGLSIIIHRADIIAMQRGLSEDLTRLRAALGDETRPGGPEAVV